MMREHDFELALSHQHYIHARFPIYRNNVAAALSGALRVRFPVVEQLVGGDFFNAMAGEYIADHKPNSAVLIHYGASFADFIASFEGAASLPYLADVAHFENGWWHSYHAADAEVLLPEALAAISPEEWGNLTFEFHPTVQLIESRYSAAAIWQWHQAKNNDAPLDVAGHEYALISRPDAAVEVRIIAGDGHAFFSHLKSGVNLETALTQVQNDFPDFDLQTNLAALIQLGLIIGVSK
jgi:hypothetical protein